MNKMRNHHLLLSLLGFALLLVLVSNAVRAEDDKIEEQVPTANDDDDDNDVDEENGVLVLRTDNFDEQINRHEFILVEFYAPWCGHCKQLAPKYEAAAARLKAATPQVVLAKVDATVESSLASRFDISGYPTLKWFKSGTVYDYDGPRDEDGIVSYMQERTDPAWRAPPDEVVVLTQNNFTQVTDSQPLTIVMFYAPWCGHCKKMAPDYTKVAEELKKQKKEVVVAKVDATVETELAKQFNVDGYPTLKIFRSGRAYDYRSDARDRWGMLSYIEGQIGDASRELSSLDSVRRHLSGGASTSDSDLPARIIGFFSSADDPQYALYTQAANELRDDYKFVHTFDTSSRDHYQITTLGTVAVFMSERFQTKHEPAKYTLHLAPDTTVEKLVEFLRNHQVPLVGEYTQNTLDKLYKSRRPLVLFFYTVDWSFEHREATQRWRHRFADVAARFRDYATFAVADEESHADLFREFGFDESAEEINVGILDERERRFPMSPMEEYDEQDVINFINRYKQGKIKPKIKSAAVPKSQKKGSPYVVVGSTFERVVLDNSKDVLIELYAPWCGHCKNLEPVYVQLARDLKSQQNLIIAKMDATANDVPAGYEASGFPTIYFAPAGKKSAPIKYEGGERTVEAFKKFISEHAVVSMGKSKKDEL